MLQNQQICYFFYGNPFEAIEHVYVVVELQLVFELLVKKTDTTVTSGTHNHKHLRNEEPYTHTYAQTTTELKVNNLRFKPLGLDVC